MQAPLKAMTRKGVRAPSVAISLHLRFFLTRVKNQCHAEGGGATKGDASKCEQTQTNADKRRQTQANAEAKTQANASKREQTWTNKRLPSSRDLLHPCIFVFKLITVTFTSPLHLTNLWEFFLGRCNRGRGARYWVFFLGSKGYSLVWTLGKATYCDKLAKHGSCRNKTRSVTESKAKRNFLKEATTPQAIALDIGLVVHPAGARFLEEGWNGYCLAM